MGKKKESEKSYLLKQIEKSRDFLAVNRFHGTIGQKRKEVVKKIECYVDKLKGVKLVGAKGIEYHGLKDFSELEIKQILSLTKTASRKLKRDFRDFVLVVSMKKHKSKGKRCKYAVHLKLEKGKKVVLFVRESDWDLAKVLHKALDNLQQEGNHKFKRNATKRRRRKFL